MSTRPTLPPIPQHTFGEPSRFWQTRDQSFLNDNGGREERPWERGWRVVIQPKHAVSSEEDVEGNLAIL